MQDKFAFACSRYAKMLLSSSVEKIKNCAFQPVGRICELPYSKNTPPLLNHLDKLSLDFGILQRLKILILGIFTL